MASTLTLLNSSGEQTWMAYPGETQETVLKNIVRKNQNTLFGREYLFREISNVKDYADYVPLSLYRDFKPYIQSMISGKEDTLVAEPFSAWMRTITMGGVKLFPYTDSVAKGIQKAFLRLFGTEGMEWRFFSGKVLAGLEEMHADALGGKPVGSISSLGVETLRKTPLFKNVFTPSSDTAHIADCEKRWMETARQVRKQDVVAAMADPLLFLLFLRKMMREYRKILGISDVAQLWPDFSLLISDGRIGPYKRALRSILKNVEFREILCTEDIVVAIQIDEKGCIPLYDQNFLEFISLKEWKDMRKEGGTYREFEFDCKTVETVTQGEEYVLVLTTPGGLYRYVTGDVVRIIDDSHITWSGWIDQESHPGQPQEMVLLREVATDSLKMPMGSQVVAVESEPLRSLFGII